MSYWDEQNERSIRRRQALLRLKGPQQYTHWEAKQNAWHDDCYCLYIDWSRGKCSGSITTYFYPDVPGEGLEDVVGRFYAEHGPEDRKAIPA